MIAPSIPLDAEQLADIAVSSAETAGRFGLEVRIAMLSYSTGASGRGEQVDVVRRATDIARRRRPDLKLDGRSSTTLRSTPTSRG